MIVTIHWSACVVETRAWCVRWAEYDFEPLPAEDRRGFGFWRSYRLPSTAVACEVPIGSKVVTRRRKETSQTLACDVRRLVTYDSPLGLDAETVARRCHFKQRGYRVLTQEEFMARKVKQAGPTLFGEIDGPAAIGAYERPILDGPVDPPYPPSGISGGAWWSRRPTTGRSIPSRSTSEQEPSRSRW